MTLPSSIITLRQTLSTLLLTLICLNCTARETTPPNIIFIMADDLGWGDVGYNGNDIIKTPHLDKIAQEGLRLDRFYAASSICSPTRASCLTGRHPWRQGILAAHTSGLRVGEITIAEATKERGYTTGMFGKWHIGWLKPDDVSGRGHYSPPWHHGFDYTFATTSAVPTWNPYLTPQGWNKWGAKEGEIWRNYPYVENGVTIKDNMKGDDSRVIMDRAIPFIEDAVAKKTPFLTCIWFHTPHEPVVAGPKYLEMYKNLSSERQRHYYGCITAMDEQIGRLIHRLEELNIDQNTLIIFTSDNGPSGPITRQGFASAGPFRGHKHTIYEGGIRVPTLMYWPDTIKAGSTSNEMSGTVDIFPTVSELVGYSFPKKKERKLDGISLVPLINGKKLNAHRNMFFGYQRLYNGIKTMALMNDQYKILRLPAPAGTNFMGANKELPKYDPNKKYDESLFYALYDIKNDPQETTDLKDTHPELFQTLFDQMTQMDQDCLLSREGAEYPY